MKLSDNQLNGAVEFMKSGARPLEKALFAYHFTGGASEAVLTELEKFQNDDGGFGHGLEPDLQLRDSSVIATTIAFQHFREVNAPSSHPMVARACQYLVSTYDAQHLNWQVTPANVDDAPHAPWWLYDGDLQKRPINPRAEIAGYLHDYPEHFPENMRQQVTESVLETLFSHPDTMEMHDLLCYVRLSETRNLPQPTRAAIVEKLKIIVETIVVRDPEQWKSYGLPPLGVIASPDSPFAPSFESEIEQNLNFIIQSQSASGSWEPSWNWGDQWVDAWEGAKREWSGVITLGNLRQLQAFGRTEGL